MPNKSAYIYAKRRFQDTSFSLCVYGYFQQKIKLKLKSGQLAPAVFPQLWKSVQVTEPLDQHQKIRHLAQGEEKKPTKTSPAYTQYF